MDEQDVVDPRPGGAPDSRRARPDAADGRMPTTSHRRLLVREALASALYLALVLLAGLVALPVEALPRDSVVVASLVGTAVGLVLAHWFAFRLAAHLTAEGGHWSRSAAQEAAAQVVGAAAVAAVAAVPFLVLSGRTAVLVSLALLATLPALTGAVVARLRGAPTVSTVVTALVVLVLALAVVAVKAALGH